MDTGRLRVSGPRSLEDSLDLLHTAVIDITTLLAAGRALLARPVSDAPARRRKLRNRLQRDIRRGTVAYIDALARSKRGVPDAALLCACRVAAEQQMAHGLRHQGWLRRVLQREPGSLDGLAAMRQDLWQLAHIAIHLRSGMAALRQSGVAVDMQAARSLAARLRRRLRKGLVAYARACLSTEPSAGPPLGAAREAALAEIGRRGAALAERLTAIEAAGDPPQAVLQLGVARPLSDLALDWHHRGPVHAGVGGDQ